MPNPELKSKKREFFHVIFAFIFGFKNTKGEILDHWVAFLDSFNYSPLEFYAAIEKELEARRIPGLSISKEEFHEGGLLSDQRIYLRLSRERLAMYTCAAPFGAGYFFSCRTVYVPALVRLWHIVATFLAFFLMWIVLIRPLGFVFSIYAISALVFALGAMLRNAASAAFSDVDSLLLRIPVVATIYEDWFRAESYWRIDTRMIYLQRVPSLVRELAEEITAAKGAKLEKQYQRAPILGELYKPVSPKTP
jgi:hypothetical protein